MHEVMPLSTVPISKGHRFSRQHSFTIDEVIAFALAAGDDNPLHHDTDFAAGTRCGRLIVSGTHTTALLLGLTASHFSKRGPVLGVGFSVSFLRPVSAEQTVALEWIVDAIRLRPNSKGRFVDLKGSLTDSSGQVCVSASGTVLVDFES